MTTELVFEVRDLGGLVATYRSAGAAEVDAAERRARNAARYRYRQESLPAYLRDRGTPDGRYGVEVYGPTPLTDVNRPYLRD